MTPAPNRRLFVLALIGCFALAFGAASALDLVFLWFFETRLKAMSFVDTVRWIEFIWRTIAALAVAVLLCIWLRRR